METSLKEFVCAYNNIRLVIADAESYLRDDEFDVINGRIEQFHDTFVAVEQSFSQLIGSLRIFLEEIARIEDEVIAAAPL